MATDYGALRVRDAITPTPPRCSSPGHDTVYAANNNDGTVSIINAAAATCNGSVMTGCATTPRAVATGAEPQFVAVDPWRGGNGLRDRHA